MHGLQACIFKYITVAAFSIYALPGEDAAKRGGWRLCFKSHGNYIADHGKSWKNMELCFGISVGTMQYHSRISDIV